MEREVVTEVLYDPYSSVVKAAPAKLPSSVPRNLLEPGGNIVGKGDGLLYPHDPAGTELVGWFSRRCGHVRAVHLQSALDRSS